MVFFKEVVLEDSVKIETSIERLWDFFENLEKNYIDWHPKDHIMYEIFKGKTHQIGSVIYAEEYILGKRERIKVVCIDVEKYKSIDYRTSFPLSVFYPKSRYVFSTDGEYCMFTAINYFRIPIIGKRKILALIKDSERHIREEGINLKKLLEDKE